MRTNVVINDDLMSSALKVSGLKTKKDAIEAGLKLLVQVKSQKENKGVKSRFDKNAIKPRRPTRPCSKAH